MRRKIVIIVATLLLVTTICAHADEPTAVPTPTTDKEITFLDLTWLMPENDAEELVKATFPDIDKHHREFTPSLSNKSSYNYVDRHSIFLPYYSSEHVSTLKLELSKEGPYLTNLVLGSVAGYPVDKITLKFIEMDKTKYNSYGLYAAEYSFKTLGAGNKIPINEEYLDLKSKLSALYGAPYTTPLGSNSFLGKSEGESSVWVGVNGTAANLVYEKYLSGQMSGDEFIDLSYGTTEVNYIFPEAEEYAQAEAERQLNEERERVSTDNSGL